MGIKSKTIGWIFDMFRKFLHICWCILAVVTATSCTTNGQADDFISYIPGMDYFCRGNLTTIKIVSSRCTNQGAPFYVLIKATDFPTYVTDDYEKITHTVIHGKQETPCFVVMCVLPGKELIIDLETPDVRTLGLYFLFTNPGKEWKCFLSLDECDSFITVNLNDNQLISVER